MPPDPPPFDIHRLGEVVLTDGDGEPHRLDQLWAKQPAVLVWLRHFGCSLCREQVADLGQLAAEFANRGARLVFIGQGTAAQARDFQAEYAPGQTVLTDPERQTYRLLGALRGVRTFLNLKVALAYRRAAKKGFHNGRGGGDPTQQGATVVVEPGGKVAYWQVSRLAGDHPDPAELLNAASARL